MSDYYDDDYYEGTRRLRAPLTIFVALVALRLAVGWHFYREGTKKLTVDKQTGQVEITFKGAEGFLRGAVGPVAELAKDHLPGFHDWEETLVVAEEYRPPSPEDLAKRAKWQRVYEREIAEVEKKNVTLNEIDEPLKPIPVKFPPKAPYAEFGERVADDWAETQSEFANLGGLTDEQKSASAQAYVDAKVRLATYLESIEPDIAEWRHELWRLEQWETNDGGSEIPFQAERIAKKRAETSGPPRGWVAEARAIEAAYFAELREIAAAAEAEEEPAEADGEGDQLAAESTLTAAVDSILDDEKAKRIRYADIGVTCLTIGVGVLLMIGLFTRLAALCGGLFLLSVMATQPPWVEGANLMMFYYQLVEVAALGLLFATAAGRFAGLDYFLHAACSKICRSKGA